MTEQISHPISKRPVVARVYLRYADGTYYAGAGQRTTVRPSGTSEEPPRRFGGAPWGTGPEPPLPSVTAPPTVIEVPALNWNIDIDFPPEIDVELPDIDLPDILFPELPLPNIELPEFDLDFPMDGIEFPEFTMPCFDGFGDCDPMPGTGSGLGALGPGGDSGLDSVGAPGGGMSGGSGSGIGTGISSGKETFGAHKCFASGSTYLAAIEWIADDLGLEPSELTVDEDCDGTFSAEKCFPKGSSKWDALWWISDQCQMQVTDPGDGGIDIVPPTPLPTVWTLNEYTNLFDFTPVLDSSELYAYVEIFRNQINQNGIEIVPDLSVIVEVPSPFSVDPTEILRVGVDPGVTEAEAENMGKSLAAKMGRMSYRVTATTLFNPVMKLREQVKIQRPSRSYEQNFMITSITHDLSETGKFTTVEAQVILDAPVVV